MTPQHKLALCATHLDEAVEQLTFDRFDLALDELRRALVALVGAVGRESAPESPCTPSAPLPRRPALNHGFRTLVGDVRALLRACDEDSDSAWGAARRAEVERLVFEASDRLILRAEQRSLVDPGAVYGSLAGEWAPDEDADETPASGGSSRSRDIPRRAALKLIGATAATALAACASRGAPETSTAHATEPTGQAQQSTVPPATVGNVTALNDMQWPTSDPFLFCAYHVDAYPQSNGQFGPQASLDGRSLGRDFDASRAWRMYHGRSVPGFPRHPHRGFETVTVVRTGLLDHADSLGAAARYGGGDVQWLTAGAGIQHAEMFPLMRVDADNPLELFQIWLNLPAANKMVEPHFTMLWADDIPSIVLRDDAERETEIVVHAGAWDGHRAPAPPPDSWASRPESDLAIWSLRMQPDATLTLPEVTAGTLRSLYLHRGNGATVGDRAVDNRSRVELNGHGAVTIESGTAETEILLMQGRPIGEPVARRGPFVMNTNDEIRQAYSDYRATGFGGWPWDGDAPVHGGDAQRFARHPDGRREEPG